MLSGKRPSSPRTAKLHDFFCTINAILAILTCKISCLLVSSNRLMEKVSKLVNLDHFRKPPHISALYNNIGDTRELNNLHMTKGSAPSAGLISLRNPKRARHAFLNNII